MPNDENGENDGSESLTREFSREVPVEVGRNYATGPTMDVGGHGPVTCFWHDDVERTLWACLECGFLTDDTREFVHEDCGRERNPANVSWGEKIAAEGFPGVEPGEYAGGGGE